MRVAYNKLVRDNIPDVIKSRGQVPVTHVLDDTDFKAALVAKLVEEAREASGASAQELPEELADILEVLQALTEALGMTWEHLNGVAAEKRHRRGGFDRRLFLEYVEQVDPPAR